MNFPPALFLLHLYTLRPVVCPCIFEIQVLQGYWLLFWLSLRETGRLPRIPVIVHRCFKCWRSWWAFTPISSPSNTTVLFSAQPVAKEKGVPDSILAVKRVGSCAQLLSNLSQSSLKDLGWSCSEVASHGYSCLSLQLIESDFLTSHNASWGPSVGHRYNVLRAAEAIW